jgi:hypothetical protein
VQYSAPICQPDPAQTGVLHPFSDPSAGIDIPTVEHGFVYGAGRVAPVHGLQQDVEHTASRRSGPRRWLRTVVWVVAAGLHPRAGATTLRVAEDLAGRMDYDTGHVRYCLEETASRLGVHRATVKRHVAVLRELGLLAWAVHGTKHNIRRALGLPGYAGTATVYAAVIPPVYDDAMGHIRVGTGYAARIVVDATGPVDNSPAAHPGAPPSLSVVKEEGKVEVEGGCTDTSRKRASRPTASPSTSTRTEKRSSGAGGARRSPAQVARDCRIAARVRPLVTWTQTEGIRRLAFALRPLVDTGLDAHDIAAVLGAWYLTWRPERPAAYIRARLAADAAQAAVAAAASRPGDNAEWVAWWAAHDQSEQPEPAAPPLTDIDRRAAREAAWANPSLVQDHLEEYGPEATLDRYGPRLTALAERLAASGNAHFTARW